ncbi:MAG: excisionase family DNA-binding protein [Caldilineaceae bacterium]|nr:excisionase family DNA-binding protein [Caldilineaceae bacterium]
MHRLTTGQAAKALRFSVDTVIRECDAGELRSEKTPGGHRRIFTHDLLAYAQRKGYTLDWTVLPVGSQQE